MIIETKNPGGRYVRRVDHNFTHLAFGYSLVDGTIPSLRARAEGSNGISFLITLNASDLAEIDGARERHAQHLKERNRNTAAFTEFLRAAMTEIDRSNNLPFSDKATGRLVIGWLRARANAQ